MNTAKGKLQATIILICSVVVICAALLAAGVPMARAQGTTLEVESVTLQEGGNSMVDIWVRGVTDPDGLGAYDIRVDYDPALVEVTCVLPGDAPFDSLVYGIYSDYLLINGFHVDIPGPVGDIRIAGLEFNCRGAGNTGFVPTVRTLVSTSGADIAALPVSGIVEQVPLESPTPAPTAPPEPTGMPTPTPSTTGTATLAPTETAAPTATAAPTVAPTLTPTPTVTPMPTTTPTVTPSVTPEPGGGGTDIWVIIGPIIGVIAVGGVVLLILRSG